MYVFFKYKRLIFLTICACTVLLFCDISNIINAAESEEVLMNSTLFRKKSLERISSPEALNDYLRVTRPAVWLILAAAVILLTGMLFWSYFTSVDSFASGSARVESGTMQIRFDDEQIARNVQPGMTVTAGESEARISSIGMDDGGTLFAQAPTDLSDGTYSVRVLFRKTRLLHLLFD